MALIIPLAGLIWTLKRSFERLQANYHYVETLTPEPPDVIPEKLAEADPALPAAPRREPPRRIGPTAIEDFIRSRQFFCAPAWHERGLLERCLWRWLKPRERVLTEFVLWRSGGMCLHEFHEFSRRGGYGERWLEDELPAMKMGPVEQMRFLPVTNVRLSV